MLSCFKQEGMVPPALSVGVRTLEPQGHGAGAPLAPLQGFLCCGSSAGRAVAAGRGTPAQRIKAFAPGHPVGLSLQAQHPCLCQLSFLWGFPLSLSLLANRRVTETRPDIMAHRTASVARWAHWSCPALPLTLSLAQLLVTRWSQAANEAGCVHKPSLPVDGSGSHHLSVTC